MPRSAVLALLLVAAAPSAAAAHPQVSARLGAGAGAAEGELVFEMHLRSELLFGADEVRAFRIGPALDLRTADFETAEAVGGLAVLLPVATGFPITLTTGAGWASRPGDADGPIALGTLAWGYRSYNHHHAYGYAFQLYATTRVGLDDTSRWEITGGIEVDLLFLVGIPAVFVWEWLTGSDPDEP